MGEEQEVDFDGWEAAIKEIKTPNCYKRHHSWPEDSRFVYYEVKHSDTRGGRRLAALGSPPPHAETPPAVVQTAQPSIKTWTVTLAGAIWKEVISWPDNRRHATNNYRSWHQDHIAYEFQRNTEAVVFIKFLDALMNARGMPITTCLY